MPALCPAKEFEQWDLIYRQGEVDPHAYLVTSGEVVRTVVPRRGAAPIEASRVRRGGLIGQNGLVRDGDGATSARLLSAHCGSKNGCKVLSISKELFSHLIDTFTPLNEDLHRRAEREVKVLLNAWLKVCGQRSELGLKAGERFWPPTDSVASSVVRYATEKPLGEDGAAGGAGGKRRGSRGSAGHIDAIRQGGLLVVKRGSAEADGSSVVPVGKTFRAGPSLGTKKVGPGYMCYCAPVDSGDSSGKRAKGADDR